MKKVALGIVLAAAALYAAVLVFFFFAQRSLIFPAPPAQPGAPATIAVPGTPTVVFFHGNGEDLSHAGPMIALLKELGAGVLAVEYPGYGGAPGTPSEESIYATAEAALKQVRGPVVLLGQSLGSGVAVEMAARGYGEKLALISPYTSIADLGARLYPWLPAHLLTQHRFDSLGKAPRIRMPVLVIHGTDDEVVPIDMGRSLARAFPNALLRLIPGGHHNDLLSAHRAEVKLALKDFLR